MKICKYAGDPTDEYCKNCDGITMEVDEKSISCTECAGYEEGNSDVNVNDDIDLPFEESTDKNAQKAHTATKDTNTTNNTPKKKKADKSENIASDKAGKVTIETPIKVSEEKSKEEVIENTSTGIRITALHYTSGATIKKGDNYFKFVAEEEWNVSQVADSDMENTREQLWAKLNGEVDAQIEELNNMN